jgi:hypothetical protein
MLRISSSAKGQIPLAVIGSLLLSVGSGSKKDKTTMMTKEI